MNIYKIENAHGIIEVGNIIEIDYEYIKVLSIVKIDIITNTVWISGVLNEIIF